MELENDGLLDVKIIRCCLCPVKFIRECGCSCHKPQVIEFKMYGSPMPSLVKLYQADTRKNCPSCKYYFDKIRCPPAHTGSICMHCHNKKFGRQGCLFR